MPGAAPIIDQMPGRLWRSGNLVVLPGGDLHFCTVEADPGSSVRTIEKGTAWQEAFKVNTIEFRVEQVRGGGLDETVIVPFVDGVSLAVLAEAFERAHGHAHPSGYTGLPIDEQASPVARYGIDPPAFENDEWEPGAVPLLDCSCLGSGCRPIVTWPEESAGVIEWRRPSYPRSDDSYEGFGPFIFDREQYESALADLRRQLA